MFCWKKDRILKQSKKVVLVDVDSTLWDFSGEMIFRMREMFPAATVPDEFQTWEQPLDFFQYHQDAYDMFADIHSHQHSYGVFPFAAQLLKALKEKDYYILIASNRHNYTKIALTQWLLKHGLAFDEIYCDLDKRELLDRRKIDLIIDDSPKVQICGIEKGIEIWTLKYKYNSQIEKTRKFNSLREMVQKVKK